MYICKPSPAQIVLSVLTPDHCRVLSNLNKSERKALEINLNTALYPRWLGMKDRSKERLANSS